MDIGDSDEAVRKVYFEYLAERHKNDERERHRRTTRFLNGDPDLADQPAIEKAREAYAQNFGTGQAENAARDALYGYFYGQEFIQKNVDPKLYSTNLDYHNRADASRDEYIQTKNQERNQTRHQQSLTSETPATPDTVSPKQPVTDQSTQALIDHVRGDSRMKQEEIPGSHELDAVTLALVQHTERTETSRDPDNANSQELIDHVRTAKPIEELVPSPRSDRNDPNRYGQLNDYNQQTPPGRGPHR